MATGMVLTNNGKKIVLNRSFKTTPDYSIVSTYQIGIGTTTPTGTDSGLENKVPMDSTEAVDACDVTTGWTDSADMTLSVNSTTYKENALSLNLTKDGTGSATASTTKATTSLDFTSKDLSVWFYVADSTVLAQLATTSCVVIRFGSDSSNYYEWLKNASFFAVGWNLIRNLTSANADSTTGAPVLTACDYSYIATVATAAGQTWVAGKIIMDDWKLADSTDYTDEYETGFPLIDETALTVTTRGILSTSQAAGYSLTEFGLFNTDSTPKLFSHMVHTAITKTTSVQVIYVEVDEFV